MKRHSDAQKLWEAKTIAREHGMFVVEKPIAPGECRYLVYRCVTPKNQCLGTRASIAGLLPFVRKCAGVAS